MERTRSSREPLYRPTPAYAATPRANEPLGNAACEGLDLWIARVSGRVMLCDAPLLADTAVAQRDLLVYGIDARIECVALGDESRFPASTLRLQRLELVCDLLVAGFVVGSNTGDPLFQIRIQRFTVCLEFVFDAFQHHVVDRPVVDFLRRGGDRNAEHGGHGEAESAEQI